MFYRKNVFTWPGDCLICCATSWFRTSVNNHSQPSFLHSLLLGMRPSLPPQVVEEESTLSSRVLCALHRSPQSPRQRGRKNDGWVGEAGYICGAVYNFKYIKNLLIYNLVVLVFNCEVFAVNRLFMERNVQKKIIEFWIACT